MTKKTPGILEMLKSKRERGRYSLYLTKANMDKIKEYAAKSKLYESEVVDDAIEYYIKKVESEQQDK